MAVAAASSLLRRFGRVPTITSTRRYISNCSLPTKIKASQTPNILQQTTPWLMLGNLSDPNSRYLYDVGRERTTDTVDLRETGIDGHTIVGSSHGFLISVKGSGEVHATNPITRLRIPLPPVTTINETPHTIRKAIFDPRTDTFALSLNRYRVAFAQPGDESWTAARSPADFSRDILFHRDRLYAVHTDGTFTTFDPCNPLSQPFTFPRDPSYKNYDFCNSYLMESPDGDDLLLVTKTEDNSANGTIPKRENFKVFKLKGYVWDQVKSIGDLALFIGPADHSLALHTPDFPTIKPNSIYFADGNSGVLNLDDKTVRYFSFANGVPKLPRSMWLMPPAME